MYSLFGKAGRRIKIVLLYTTMLAICFGVAVLCMSADAGNHIVINEICSNNFSVAKNENGNYADYIELYNPAEVPVSLTGFSVSDSPKELYKCSLDTVMIPAGGYYIVWADGTASGSVGHADFKISKTGETIYLSNHNGEIIDSVEVPALEYNTVYARKTDGDEVWERKTATCSVANEDGKVVLSVEGEGPIFSVESGFFEEEFELILEAGEGKSIYYTLDGSQPTQESMRYETPILIGDASLNDNVYSARTDLQVPTNPVPSFKVDKATIVRAVSFDEKSNSFSKTVTETYFVNFKEKREYEGYSIISLVTDPENLFNEDTGIYGNGRKVSDMIAAGQQPDYTNSNAMNVGKEWERDAVLQYFDKNHQIKLRQGVGIRISGESTRSKAQKSFNIYARDIYDESDSLEYNFFEDMKYSSIKLRNGGSDYEKSKIMDAFLQEMSAERHVSIQMSIPCVVFLNGEYWGVYNIRERYKEEYFENHYGISASNIWMLDAGRASIGSYDAWNDFEAVKKFIIENDMSQAENYETASELIDIQSLIDIYCINIYVDNTDMAFDKNMGAWRTVRVGEQKLEDGKWRFMLYDMDGAMNAPENNTFTESVWWKEDFDLMDEPIIKSLMQNPEFRKQFYDTFMEIANDTFDYTRMHEELMRWKDIYKVQAVKTHHRFLSEDITAEEYAAYIETMDDFFKRRNTYIIKYLEEEMANYD